MRIFKDVAKTAASATTQEQGQGVTNSAAPAGEKVRNCGADVTVTHACWGGSLKRTNGDTKCPNYFSFILYIAANGIFKLERGK